MYYDEENIYCIVEYIFNKFKVVKSFTLYIRADVHEIINQDLVMDSDYVNINTI